MLSSSLDTLLKVSKTTYPKKLSAYDGVTLYVYFIYMHDYIQGDQLKMAVCFLYLVKRD